jgi:hypothetical protein
MPMSGIRHRFRAGFSLTSRKITKIFTFATVNNLVKLVLLRRTLRRTGGGQLSGDNLA